MTIMIWHTTYHDDYRNTELSSEVPGIAPHEVIRGWKEQGGVWIDKDHTQFVPWHRINFIEVKR